MYLGIDVGATKTLFAVFMPDGDMVCEKKIKTNPDYGQFKSDIASELKELGQFEISYCCVAIPGTIDFKTGTALAFGNENWRNLPIKNDVEKLIPGGIVLIHNDAKLAGLSEARLVQEKYKKVLYLTISTGIGGGVITNGVIDPAFENFEPGQMVFENEGKTMQWEDIASGRALKERFGKMASEIEDPQIWQEYVKSLVAGFENLLATVRPDSIIIGGGVGSHFEKFKPYLESALKEINNPQVPLVPLLEAQRPEEAVIYGCYDYIIQNL